MNSIIRYFDLASTRRPAIPTAQAAAPKLYVLPQYVALVLGIMIEPYFQRYQLIHQWQWYIEGIFGRVLFALIVGLMIFPAVYKNAFDETKPWFVQVCPIFTAGVGWQALLGTVMSK